MTRSVSPKSIRSLLLGAICVLLQHSGLAYVTDSQLYSPVNYFTLRPPAAGATYVDPAFGTEVMRIERRLSTPDAANVGMLRSIANEYSTMTPFNADNSRLLLQHHSYFALYDGQGHYLNDLPFEITASSEPRWSRHDANLLYYVTGNQLKQFDTASRTASAVHTFSDTSSSMDAVSQTSASTATISSWWATTSRSSPTTSAPTRRGQC